MIPLQKGRASDWILAPKVTAGNGENLASLRVGGRTNASVPTQSDSNSFPFGNRMGFWGIPLPRRISGINELAGKLEIIYRTQSVTGKILSRKELALIGYSCPYRYRLGHDLLFGILVARIWITEGCDCAPRPMPLKTVPLCFLRSTCSRRPILS